MVKKLSKKELKEKIEKMKYAPPSEIDDPVQAQVETIYNQALQDMLNLIK